MGRFANQQRCRHHGQAGLLAAALCGAPAARGADEPVILSWSVPPEADCPDATYALREIRRHLGPAPAERPPIRASVVIRGAGGRYQMVLKTEQGDTEGERILSDASCGAVADAAIVVLAWMIDPNARPDPSRNPATLPATPAAEPAPRDAMVEPAPRRTVTFIVGLGPSGDVGTLPSFSMGAEARVDALLRPFRMEAHGSFWPSRSTTIGVLPDGRGTGGTFTLWALGVQACFDVALDARAGGAALSLCAGPELDVMKGRGFGVSQPADGTKSWVAATAGVRAGVPLGGPWRASLAMTGIVPARREHFSLQGVGEVHQPAAVAARAGLDVELAF